MTRESEGLLLDFCVEQRRGFDAAAWRRFSGVGELELAATARYLAGTRWFGHAKELSAVADEITPLNFEELVGRTNFDPSRFRGLLQAHLDQLEVQHTS